MRTAWGELRRQLSDQANRLFQPREILLRTDGRVRYVTLTRRQQVAAAGLCATIIGWTLVSSAGFLFSGYMIGTRDAQVRRTAAAYDSLRAQVVESRQQFAALAHELAAHQKYMLDIVRGDAETAGGLVAVPSLPAGDADLRIALSEVKSQLALLANNNRTIERRIAEVQGQLAGLDEARRHAAEARDRFAARWHLADSGRAAAAATNAGLNGQIAELQGQLAALRLAQAHDSARRAALNSRIAALSGDKAAIARENDRLQKTVGAMQRTLAAIAEDRSALRESRNELASLVGTLENRLTSVQSTQQTIVQKLADRTRVGIEEVEKTVSMTGLDVETLLFVAGRKTAGAGGPYIVPGRMMRSTEERLLMASVENLDDAVGRWENLQLVLRTLPLTAPLDHYSIGSGYGTRKDPFNGKRAMHEGLDLRNDPGTAVLATAPGKVVYAGWMGDYGRLVEIDHGLGIRTRYAHLKTITVKVGQAIEYRQEIGKLGTSGRSSGPHVHYEVRVNGKPYDPMNFLEAGRYVFKG